MNIPARTFAGMGWVVEKYGTRANINPGQAKKEQLRHAIQSASHPNYRTIYSHTGWRKVDGEWCYLYSGGAIGANGLDVELEGNLTAYTLDVPAASPKASADFLEVGTLRVTAPLLCAMYLAPLCEFARGDRPAFVTSIVGQTGSRKTAICALAMSHFGNFNSKQTTASFADTANSIIRKAFIVKDAPLLVDDYHPTTSCRNHENMKATAQKLARAYGDLNGRSRANPDGSMQVSTPPRGLGIMSGEQVPDIGESGTARYYLIEIGMEDVPPTETLTSMQEKARNGALRGAMRGYIEWLSPQAEKLPQRLESSFTRLRQQIAQSLPDIHGRIVEAVAWLLVSLELMEEYFNTKDVALDHQAIEEALIQNAQTQAKTQSQEKPVDMFLETLQQLLATNRVCIDGYGETQGGERIGYMKNTEVHLFPMAAFNAVCKMYKEQDSHFPISRTDLWKRMGLKGFKENHNGKTAQVLAISRERLEGGHEVMI